MDIGTAKPDAATLLAQPHHLVNILDPAQSYSAAQFSADARPLIAAARARGALPVLVGGTGLYFRALEQGLAPMPAANAELRAQIAAEGAALGWPTLHARLQRLDAESAALIKPTDPQRISRALEIYALTGLTRSQHWQAQVADILDGPLVKIALSPPAKDLYQLRMAQRFQQMMDDGFLQEVMALHQRGDLHLGLPSIRAVGYRQLWEHLDGQCGLAQAVEKGMIATRQYAKRQMTWLRGETDVHWLNPTANNALSQVLHHLSVASIAASAP